MDKRLLAYLQRENMVSLMNSTKWRELAVALQGIKGSGPKVRIKYLLDEEPTSGFSHLDWEWVKYGNSEVIEWLELDTILKAWRGKLLPEREEDMMKPISSALREVGVPFTVDCNILKAWGYVRAGDQPEFS